MTTPPNSMSYMGPGTAMAGLYDIQTNKSIPPEQQQQQQQQLIYLSAGQVPAGVSVHPQYLQQSLAATHQFSVRQATVSTK